MKKVLFVGMLFGALLAFTSCKKEYTCECVTTSNMPGTASGSSTTTIKDKKDVAQEDCENGSSSVTSGQYQVKTECKIK